MKRIGATFMDLTDLKLTATRGTMALALLALCACGGAQQAQAPEAEDVYDDSFQLSGLINELRTAPDEFGVLTKRPLELPGDFDTLPVPEPGKRSTRDPNPEADARAALLSTPSTPVVASGATIAPSATEAAILSSLSPADPAIRQTLAAEQAEFDSEQDLYVLDRVFPRLREVRGDLDREQLDGNAERLRLLESGIGAQPRSAGVATIPATTTAAPVSPVPPTPRLRPRRAAPFWPRLNRAPLAARRRHRYRPSAPCPRTQPPPRS